MNNKLFFHFQIYLKLRISNPSPLFCKIREKSIRRLLCDGVFAFPPAFSVVSYGLSAKNAVISLFLLLSDEDFRLKTPKKYSNMILHLRGATAPPRGVENEGKQHGGTRYAGNL